MVYTCELYRSKKYRTTSRYQRSHGKTNAGGTGKKRIYLRAAILVAEGIKESAVRKVEGEVEGFIKVKKATAEGIEMIKNDKANSTVIALRSLEILAKELAKE